MAKKKLPPGPFRTIDLGNGKTAPMYLMPFTRKGAVKAPKTRKHLIEAAASGGFTHVFVFSHGWNNDFKISSRRYGEFIDLFTKTRQEHSLEGGYKPLLVGIIWPSAALVMPWERGPKMAAIADLTAASTAEKDAAAVEEDFDELDDVAELLAPEQVERFYELAQADALDEAETNELAVLLQPLFKAPEETVVDDEGAPSIQSLIAASSSLRSLSPAGADDDEVEEPGGFAGEGAAAPQAAGALGQANPRNLIRLLTVWRMKDRAGVVGARGVGPLLRDLRDASSAKIHLIGHSYGAKVVMSALVANPDFADDSIESALLLQPAVNGFCFAEEVPDTDLGGAYHKTLRMVRQPIMTTFSKHDFALTKVFHLAVRRGHDLGENQPAIASASGIRAPSRFAALGGYGPQGCPPPGCETIEIQILGNEYPEPGAAAEILALKSDHAINGHGGIVNDATIWALLNQVRRSLA